MYVCLMYSSELIKGTLKTIVLNLLKEQGRMYGYEITQRVKELTGGKIQITEEKKMLLHCYMFYHNHSRHFGPLFFPF